MRIKRLLPFMFGTDMVGGCVNSHPAQKGRYYYVEH